jgi:hypothetical protein
MISNDVLSLVQLDPPGIELCRISNRKKEEGEGEGGGGDGGATNSRDSRNYGPCLDKLCTLLLPPLRQRQDTGARARVAWAFCSGEHPGHQMFSRGAWPERRTPLGRRQMFHQLMKDSILKVMMYVMGCEGQSRAIDVVVRCATLLTYADGAHVVPPATATVASDAESSDGDGDGRSASADNDAKGGTGDDGVPWDAWGPRATAMSDREYDWEIWSHLLGERMSTIENIFGQFEPRISIRDYNPYRIRQARASMMAKGPAGHGGEDSHGEEEGDEGEGIAHTLHPKGTRRIIESSTIRGGDCFQEDITTALAHLDVEVDVPGCTAIFMEQNQVLFHLEDADEVSGMCRCDRLMMHLG